MRLFRLVCADGVCRHEGFFESRAAALHWGTWRHVCPFYPHRLERRSVPRNVTQEPVVTLTLPSELGDPHHLIDMSRSVHASRTSL